jgi:Ca2+-binding RTX toxin-like protein
VTADNDAAVVTTSSEQIAATIDPGLAVTDVDNVTLASAMVSITGNFHSGEDVLAFVNDGLTMGNVAGAYDAGTGVLDLTSSGATATLAQWQAALRAVTYTDTSDAPNTENRTISFVVNDGADASTATKTVSVAAVNDAPTIASNGGNDTAALSITENATAVTTVTATDPDAGQTLTYSITGGADAGKFTIGSSTGALSFITAPNFEAPTDTGGNNVYDVTVQVSDGNSGTDTQAIAVTVQDVAGVTINGTDQAQTLTGTGEADIINGLGGNDTLSGLAGNDTLDGGAGRDAMAGGTGNDTYVVDNSGDVVTENSGEGIDTVQSSVTYTLGLNMESLTLTGTSKIDGTGNAANNVITGNGANNVLAGLGGADAINGGGGNDTIKGGDGGDTLTGGPGNDTFVLAAVADSIPATPDIITDFFHGQDKFDFSAIDANTSSSKAAKGDQAFLFAGQNANVVANSVSCSRAATAAIPSSRPT